MRCTPINKPLASSLRSWALITSSPSRPTARACTRMCKSFSRPVLFFPRDPARKASRTERNRGRREWRQLTLQDTNPEQVCFVAASQIGQLKTRTWRQSKSGRKNWAVITSASPTQWTAAALLKCRREYWGIEGQFHQRLDATLDEDRSRVRTPKAMMVLGMFRRLVVSFATAWMAFPH